MNQIGLILEGGANRGIFTAGVLDFFQERGIYLPYVLAVSMGSCNAMDYLSRQAGRTRQCMFPKEGTLPGIHWRHIWKTGSIIDMDLAFDDYPNRLVPFDYEGYFAAEEVCEFVVTNCENGQAEYLTEKKDKNRLMKVCRASCSVPYFAPMVELDGIPYLDGGIADAIPIRRAINQGYEKNIVILTREKGYRKKASKTAHFLNGKEYRKYPKLVEALESRFARYNETCDYLERLEAEGKALIIRPSKVLAGRMDNNAAHLEAFYRQGYEMAKGREKEIREFLGLD